MHPAHQFKHFWNDLSLLDDSLLILQDKRIIVPASAQDAISSKLHESHSGVSRTKMLARQLYYWLGFAKDIEMKMANCEDCQKYQASQHEHLQKSNEVTFPMQAVGIDLCDYGGTTTWLWLIAILHTFGFNV